MRSQSASRNTLSPAVVLAALVASVPGTAQGTDFDRCADIEGDAERLACFDGALEEQNAAETAPARPGVPTAVPASPVAEPAPASSAGKVTQGPAAGGATPEPSAGNATPESSTTPARAMSEELSGATEPVREQHKKPRARPELPREYTAVVVAIRKRPHGQMVVTLDNGEVWSEQYASRAFLVAVGDTITMKKSLMTSSYRLVAPGGRGYKMTRLD